MSYIGKVNLDSTAHLVGSTLYGTCSTGASTAAKAVTCTNFDQLMTGVTIHVKFTYSNTASNPTLNVNSTGAKSIYRYGTTVPSTSAKTSWNAGAVVSFTYDGSAWIMNDWLNDDTDTHRPIKMNGTQILASNTTALDLVAGTNVTLSNSSGAVTIAAKDTTYGVVTDMGPGLVPQTYNGTYTQPHFLMDNTSQRTASWEVPPNATTSYSGYMSATDKIFIENLKTRNEQIIVIDVASFSTLPVTVYSTLITADHYILNSTLSNPEVQTGDWTVTTSMESLTISGDISGSTTAHFVLGKVSDSSDLIVVVNIPSFDALPISVSNSHVSTDHVVLASTLSNPAAQVSDWTITTSDGLVSVSGDIVDSTTLQLVLGLAGNI